MISLLNQQGRALKAKSFFRSIAGGWWWRGLFADGYQFGLQRVDRNWISSTLLKRRIWLVDSHVNMDPVITHIDNHLSHYP